MQLDFFSPTCDLEDGNCKKEGVVCLSSTSAKLFGICDDTPPPNLPAYINHSEPEKWLLTLENPNNGIQIIFKAIDNCVEIRRESGAMAKRCDGLLIIGDKLVFVELKNRGYKGWLPSAREQIEETISTFKNAYPEHNFEVLEPIIANRQQYKLPQNLAIEEQKLKDAIGLKFRLVTHYVIE